MTVIVADFFQEGFAHSSHQYINGLRHKRDHIERLIDEQSIDILSVCKTKLTSDVSDGEVQISQFTMFRKDRASGSCGGGVALFALTGLAVSRCNAVDHPDIESIWLSLRHRGQTFQMGTIYRSRGERVDFWLKLEQSWHALQPQHVVILGDFNADPTSRTDAGPVTPFKTLFFSQPGLHLRVSPVLTCCCRT